MILQIEDWTFDVDLEATRAYSATEVQEHCTCAYCRNFYAAVDLRYPRLRPFLAQFGLDIEAPDHMSPIDHSVDRIDYDPDYCVFGTILQYGLYELSVGVANIVPGRQESLNGRPAFSLYLYEVSLPWVLDEPFEGGIPEPPRRQNRLRRLFGRKDLPQ